MGKTWKFIECIQLNLFPSAVSVPTLAVHIEHATVRRGCTPSFIVANNFRFVVCMLFRLVKKIRRRAAASITKQVFGKEIPIIFFAIFARTVFSCSAPLQLYMHQRNNFFLHNGFFLGSICSGMVAINCATNPDTRPHS